MQIYLCGWRTLAVWLIYKLDSIHVLHHMHSDKICKMQYKFTEIESIPKVYQAKNPDAKFAAKIYVEDGTPIRVWKYDNIL